MTAQPEALRLADALEFGVLLGDDRDEAAAELRRLHEKCEALTADTLEEMRRINEIRYLVTQRDALLEAYRKMKNVAAGYSNCCDDSGTTRRLESEFEEADSIARAAIKAVEEGK